MASKDRRGLARTYCPYSSAVEHFLGKEEVSGSSPDMGSIIKSPVLRFIFGKYLKEVSIDVKGEV